ncbi:putative Zinc carboxypeptidase [Trypanosoma vivax]|uniref:Putative zinc carboxypeptidase (Metallo-peptidase, clan mc, family m14) n=1 Tax=Trypanosoma vivax (strain Y486) TaxID=1055687 RepID=G0U7Z8_TRYVY|nr:putative Zinc carboxypeptidase [Trypanosoma vivax]CCC52006.1 metallo-peptidase, Clan MC, Family M14 [Trypanosoma vivax Y486]
MPRVARRELKNKAAGIVSRSRSNASGSGPTAGTGGVSVPRSRQHSQQPRKRTSISRRPLKHGGKAYHDIIFCPSPQDPFPFPFALRMTTAKTMYSNTRTLVVGRGTESGVTTNNRAMPTDEAATAEAYLRQMRVVSASFSGRLLGETTVAYTSCVTGAVDGNGVGCVGSSSAISTGQNLYDQIYELHQWVFAKGMSCVNGRLRVSKNAWQGLFNKKNNIWRSLMSVLGSELILNDENTAAGMLTLLYNLMRTLGRRRRRRAVRACAKLELSELCYSIVELYDTALADSLGVRLCNTFQSVRKGAGDGAHNDKKCSSLGSKRGISADALLYSPALVRIYEATALLLALCGVEDGKVLNAVRRLRLLTILLRAAGLFFTTLQYLLNMLRNSEEGGLSACPLSPIAECHLRTSSIIGCIKTISDALLHLLVSLHQLSVSPANAEFIGLQGVMLCMQVGWMVQNHLTQVPAPRRSACPNLQKSLEALALWSVELIHRLYSKLKKIKLALEVTRQQRIVDLLAAFIKFPLVNVDLVFSSLNLLNFISTRDTKSREQLYCESGGLASLVQGLLSSSELMGRLPTQWHKIFILLYKLFGISSLPGEHKPARVNDQVTSTVRVVPTLPTHLQHEPVVASELCSLGSEASTGRVGSFPYHLIDMDPSVHSPEMRIRNAWLAHSDFDLDTTIDVDKMDADPCNFVPPHALPWLFSDSGVPLCHELSSPQFSVEGIHHSGLFASVPSEEPQALQPPSDGVRVRVLKRMIERLCTTPRLSDRVVYERPALALATQQTDATDVSLSKVHDGSSSADGPCILPFLLGRGTKADTTSGFLKFRSNFESGNLQRAVAVASHEYDLILSCDTNTNCHIQWFCFSVENYIPGETYHFNILNMEKPTSTFNEGQRPVMLFVECPDRVDEGAARPRWVHCGYDIFYYQNFYERPARSTTTPSMDDGSALCHSSVINGKHGNGQQASDRAKKKKMGGGSRRTVQQRDVTSYSYTLSFSVQFPERQGCVYFANCYPYTYSNLLSDLESWKLQSSAVLGPSVLFSVQQLCCTPGGLPVPIITLTASESRGNCATNEGSSTGLLDTGTDGGKLKRETLNCTTTEEFKPIRERPVCIVTARVHPGESNASWMMRGLMSLILSDQEHSHLLRGRFVWKVIPMLNPDGVVLGNHRCSIGGADLNRDYADPKPQTNPVVFSLKRLTQHFIKHESRSVALFADLHGHSRAKNFLMYGCARSNGAVKNSKLATKGALTPTSGTSVVPNSPANIGKVATATSPFSPSSMCVEKLLPILLSELTPSFSLQSCSFAVQRSKRFTGRVVMYRQFGIRMSYTLEATLMGGMRSCQCTTGVVPTHGEVKQVGRCRSQSRSDGHDNKGADATSSKEIAYNTSHFERMGAMLAHSINLLVSDLGDVPSINREAIERAWSQLVTSSNPEGTPNSTTISLGGSYALATRKERRTEPRSVGRERPTAWLLPSTDQREAVLRVLRLRPRPAGVSLAVSGPTLLGDDIDNESSIVEEDEEDENECVDQLVEDGGESDDSVDNEDEEDEDDDDDGEGEDDDENEQEISVNTGDVDYSDLLYMVSEPSSAARTR